MLITTKVIILVFLCITYCQVLGMSTDKKKQSIAYMLLSALIQVEKTLTDLHADSGVGRIIVWCWLPSSLEQHHELGLHVLLILAPDSAQCQSRHDHHDAQAVGCAQNSCCMLVCLMPQTSAAAHHQQLSRHDHHPILDADCGCPQQYCVLQYTFLEHSCLPCTCVHTNTHTHMCMYRIMGTYVELVMC